MGPRAHSVLPRPRGVLAFRSWALPILPSQLTHISREVPHMWGPHLLTQPLCTPTPECSHNEGSAYLGGPFRAWGWPQGAVLGQEGRAGPLAWGPGWSYFWGPHLDPGELPPAPGLLCQRLCAFLSLEWVDQVPFLLCADWDPPDWTTGLTALNLGGRQARPREGSCPQHCPVPSRGGSAAAQCCPRECVA